MNFFISSSDAGFTLIATPPFATLIFSKVWPFTRELGIRYAIGHVSITTIVVREQSAESGSEKLLYAVMRLVLRESIIKGTGADEGEMLPATRREGSTGVIRRV